MPELHDVVGLQELRGLGDADRRLPRTLEKGPVGRAQVRHHHAPALQPDLEVGPGDVAVRERKQARHDRALDARRPRIAAGQDVLHELDRLTGGGVEPPEPGPSEPDALAREPLAADAALRAVRRVAVA